MDGCAFSLLLLRFTWSDRYPEGSEADQYESTVSTPQTTPAPSLPPPPTAPPKIVPPKSDSTTERLGKYKKRALACTDDNSEEDDDVDMDDIESNDSSGSSVDSDHVPAKRLRTSIATRSSRTTPTPSLPIETDISQSPPPAVHDNPPPAVRDDFPLAVRDDPPLVNTNSPALGGLDFGPGPGSIGAHVNPTGDTAPSTMSSPSHAPLPDIVASTPPVPSRPSLPSLASDSGEIPDFLIGKHDIYGYFSSVKEPGFQALLKIYITFELTNRSSVRGILATARRPKAVGWWSGRARPDKIPPYDSLNSFTSSIVEWWTFVQPDWRKIEPGKVSRATGDWERLYQPGVNGLLNIVALAHWWARILEQRESPVNETYSWFVADVTWVLSQLTAAARLDIY